MPGDRRPSRLSATSTGEAREPMTVASMLSKKPIQDIVTVKPTTGLREACDLLAERKIGAVVVTAPDGSVAGILSERDIVRGLAEQVAQSLEATVADFMTAPVQTCTSDDTADDAMRRMSEGRFRHLPVVDGGTLVGVISIGDVVKNRIAMLEQEADAMRGYIMTG